MPRIGTTEQQRRAVSPPELTRLMYLTGRPLAKRVNRLRRLAHLTRAELAARLGLTLSGIDDRLQGRQRFTIPELCYLAEHVFGVSIDELLNLNEECD